MKSILLALFLSAQIMAASTSKGILRAKGEYSGQDEPLLEGGLFERSSMEASVGNPWRDKSNQQSFYFGGPVIEHPEASYTLPNSKGVSYILGTAKPSFVSTQDYTVLRRSSR